MRIPLNRQDTTPLFRQIEAFLRHGILSGSLATDTRLPSMRELARDLGVNRITVESAYAELEADGLVSSRVGSGTFVLPLSLPEPPAPRGPGAVWPLWQQELRPAPGALAPVTPAEMLRRAGHRSPITFAEGIGDTRLFPAEDFRKVIQTVMRRDGASSMEYGEREGYLPLRSTISHVLASQGLHARPDDVLITTGSQQAIALAAQVLLQPGQVVLVEIPTYGAALELFRLLGLRIVGIPTDEQGMDVDQLEELLQKHHPRLIYTIPNFHNPTGTCMSGPRRRRLLALADRYNVPVLEDDFVGDLRYEGRAQPALKSLDPGGRVIYAGTYSKMLMPGIRVGFLVADGPVFDRLLGCKRVNDLATPNLMQRALVAYVTVGRYQAHLRRSIRIYRKRRDAMLEAVRRRLPAGTWTDTPSGGLFLWVRLPEGMSSGELLPRACEEGVAFLPGIGCFPDPQEGTGFMRLNFAANPPEEIEEGVRRLERAMRRLGVKQRPAAGA